MKTPYFAGCALAALTFGSPLLALDITVGGNVAFQASEGEVISGVATGATGFNTTYTDDVVVNKDLAFKTSADLTVKSNTKTRALDYGTYINFDIEQTGSGSALDISDMDAHIRLRTARATLRFGTDIDGLQNAEDLDWVTVGPYGLSNSISAPIAGHKFTHSAKESSINGTDGDDVTTGVGESSITVTSEPISGFTLAAEGTPDGSGDFDWGASAKYMGSLYAGTELKAVVATDSSKAILANAKLDFGDISLNGFYGEDDDAEEYIGAAAAYDMGALTLSAGFVNKRAEALNGGTSGLMAKQLDYLVGAAYQLAPGLTVDGSYIQEERDFAATGPVLEAARYAGRIKVKF